MCGGLGPTHDDLTRDAIAAVMGVDLVRDDAVADVIRELFAARGRRMADNNLRQAMVPVGATIIPQTRGTAPGLICPVTVDGVDKVVYAVPGVPHEMYDMVQRAILPDLRRRSGDDSVIASRVLRTWGESESGLNERLDDVIDQLEGPDTPTLGVPGERLGRVEGAPDPQGADAGRVHGAARSLGAGGSRGTRRPRVRHRRRHDGIGRARPVSRPGVDVGDGRIGDRRLGRCATDGDSRCQRRVPWRDRELRDRGQADAARRGGGAGGERGGGASDGPRCA